MGPAVLLLHRDPGYPPTSGGEVRAWKTAERLAEYGTVRVAYPCREPHVVADRVVAIPTGNLLSRSKLGRIYLWNAALALGPDNPVDRLLTRLVLDAVGAGGGYDVVVCEAPQLLRAAEALAARHDARLLVDMHNATYELLAQQLAPVPVPDALRRRAVGALRAIEQKGIDAADAVVFQSPDDQRRFAIPDDAIVRIVPNGCEYDRIRHGGDPAAVARDLGIDPDRPLCVFVGAYDYEPNRLAAEFVRDRLATALPDAEFLLVGRDPPRVDRPNVLAPGYVDDLPGALALADIALCPLTTGSGTKLKVMDYLAAGLPLVTTEVGAQGIPLRDGWSALVRDPDEMPAAVRTLVETPALRSKLSANASRLGRAYDWDRLLRGYDDILAEWFE